MRQDSFLFSISHTNFSSAKVCDSLVLQDNTMIADFDETKRYEGDNFSPTCKPGFAILTSTRIDYTYIDWRGELKEVRNVCMSICWKCNFPTHPHVRLLVSLVGWLVCYNPLKGKEITLSYFYRSTLLNL